MHAGALLPAQYHSGGLPMGFQSTSPTPMPSSWYTLFLFDFENDRYNRKNTFFAKK